MSEETPRLINGKKETDRLYMYDLGFECGKRTSGEEIDTRYLADNHMAAMQRQGFRFRDVAECRAQWKAGFEAGYVPPIPSTPQEDAFEARVAQEEKSCEMALTPYELGQFDYRRAAVERHKSNFISQDEYWQYVDGYRNGHPNVEDSLSEQHPLLQDCLKRLQEIQTELKSMEVLPEAATNKAVAMHDAWMKQSKRIQELRQEAKNVALWVVPFEVTDALFAINNLTRELYTPIGTEARKNDQSK